MKFYTPPVPICPLCFKSIRELPDAIYVDDWPAKDYTATEAAAFDCAVCGDSGWDIVTYVTCEEE